MTNKLVKRRTLKPIRFQGTVVALEGVGCCFTSSADRQHCQSKDYSMCGWVGGAGVGGGLLPRPILLSWTPLEEDGERNLGVSY